ncbi:hypothetical protein PGTUg99_005146 [Puccinia graminis f. sp. tritici]|uniref:Uncharacterized protein n=1 Tax=Puccinia graminis f. sp. tritici TaxID=56615 RepID=A0A5B0RDD6_PUCGR|nr:hypothetical protein PGTUg99_005146 [Puccinia graminis f. sp. tritici]
MLLKAGQRTLLLNAAHPPSLIHHKLPPQGRYTASGQAPYAKQSTHQGHQVKGCHAFI